MLLAKGIAQIDQLLTALNQQALKEIIQPMRQAIGRVRKQTLNFQNSIKEQAHV